MKKRLILIGLFFFLFFINISSTKALQCYYQLPFIGIDGDGNMVDAQSIGCQNGAKCMVDATIVPVEKTINENYDDYVKRAFFIPVGHTVSSYLTIPDAIRSWDSPGEGFTGDFYTTVNASIMIGMNGIGSFDKDECEYMDCLTNSGKFFSQDYCPKFIMVKTATEDQISEWKSKEIDYVKEKKNVHWWQVGGTTVNAAPSKIGYQYGTIEAKGHARYQDQVNSFSETDINHSYLPLIDYMGGTEVTQENKELMNGYIEDNFKVFKEVVIPKWYNLVEKLDSNVESACSSLKNPWYEYINFKNYKDVGNRIDYYNYMNKDYSDSGLSSYDAGINKGCWDARRELAKLYFTSGNYFMSAIGINRDGSTNTYSNEGHTGNKYSLFFSNDISNLNAEVEGLAKKWIIFEWNFAALNIGVDGPLKNFKSTNSDVADVADAQAKAEQAKKGYEFLQNDKCAYLCEKESFDEDTDDEILTENAYNYCKSSNSEYLSCNTKLKECESSTQNNCSGIGDANAQKQCLDTYNNNIFNCLKTKGLGNAQALYENALLNAKKIYDKAMGNLNNTVDSKQFKFYIAEPASITWKSTKYKGNCEDVEILHKIWVAIVIAGPFLVIILGSIDYFKIVMSSGDSIKDAIKKNKKNFVRRIVALVILVLTPVLVKLLVTNFTSKEDGAQNLTLMRCIVNGK